MGTEIDQLKQAAAERAVSEISDGMVVGLGTGSTAAFAIEAVARRIAGGLKVTCIPTSSETARAARQHGIPLTDFSAHREIDLTIDGADQVERHTLHLVKGGGGALLHEKIVAAASKRVVIIIDHSKLVDRLGGNMPLPVEVMPFGYQVVASKLGLLGLTPHLRRKNDEVFVTDGGHNILDCRIDEIADAIALERQIAQVVGVVESGLFINLATTVIVAYPAGIDIVKR
jgi:ribose 5-phosphate isomerase A